MKLIIAGGRNYYLRPADFDRLDAIRAAAPVSEVVSGGATGADVGGEAWARARGIPVRRFLAGWNVGPQAGPMRNAEMAAYADACVLFPGGRGTADMRRKATAAGLRVIEGCQALDATDRADSRQDDQE